MILYVNACVREGSRTKRLADALISRLSATSDTSRLLRYMPSITAFSFIGSLAIADFTV